jgi:ATP-dependent protease ClpP protease subunit
MYFSLFKKLCMTEKQRDKLGKEIALIIVSIGGIITLSYAIYFIVDTLKKWY